mmetsp:Transcript_27299/g.37616  ORF Transcript_27299/g.37616 Transcript_27299/m.37616 type:complete len:162 (-) Transcript_27299:343-828(-)
MTILKILFAERNCDEKLGSKILENSTAYLGAYNIYCAFTVVSNGFNALECFEHTKFNIVFLERNLGEGLDGVEVLNVLRSADIMTPVVLLTSNESEDSTGFQSALMRPFSLEQLENCILTLCNVQKVPSPTVDTVNYSDENSTNESEAYSNIFLSSLNSET